MLRKIFGAKRGEVTGEWRKLHYTKLHALYSSPDIIRNVKSRRFRCAGHVARMGESRNAYRVLVRRPEGKRPLGRPRCRWEDNIKMDLREVGYDDREWINLAQDRNQWRAYVRATMNLRSHLRDTGRRPTNTLIRILAGSDVDPGMPEVFRRVRQSFLRQFRACTECGNHHFEQLVGVCYYYGIMPRRVTRKGRPRSRWIDGVDGDARALGVRNWRMVALDRDGWKRVLEEAKTQQ
ncbi:hypothetical protein ANN_14468 [Periplaneta americana]|uniref:Uncharacterized protein n=1 Tax=Periplaneta americana TaxID=6978 RepID=A0ABQ8SWE0_PERAM|nr:hypothetical protein ANN_14468 [Periplaneta americana]